MLEVRRAVSSSSCAVQTPMERHCEHCGSLLHGKGSQLYCNATCRAMAHRARQAAKAQASRDRLDDFGDVLLLRDVAAVLKTSDRTIKRRLRAGTFPIRTLPSINKRRRFAKVDVARFLNRQQGGQK